MINLPFARTPLCTLTLLLAVALCLAPSVSFAKLSAAPGEDGAPPNSETQAEVDALNEALEPPEEGESWDEWEAELQAAYEDLHGAGSYDAGANVSTLDTSADPQPTIIDMCRSPFNAWVESTSQVAVVDALANAGQRSRLVSELERVIDIRLRGETAGTALRIDSVTVDALACVQCAMTYEECLTAGLGVDFCKSRYVTCPRQATADLALTVRFSVLTFGVPIAAGAISVDAGASYRETETSMYNMADGSPFVLRERCVSVRDYDITGLNPIVLASIRARITSTLEQVELCTMSPDLPE
jgi:hypothetical protein